MPDLKFSISEPVSAIVTAAAEIAKAILEYAIKYRETMSPDLRDEQDRITFQSYWDWRNLLRRADIVGDPEPWPPVKVPPQK